MSEVEAVDEGQIEGLLEISIGEIQKVEQDQLGPQHKLQAIDQILADEHEAIETSEQKLDAIKAAIAGQLAPQETQQSFNNPEEGIENIQAIIKDTTLNHPHQKLASMEETVKKHSNSKNPLWEIRKTLRLLEEAGLGAIKEEKKLETKRKDAYRTEMDEKAKHYPEMARGQEFWKNIGMVGTAVGAAISLKNAALGEKFSNAASQATQAGGKIDELYKQDKATHLDHTTKQYDQDSTQQGQTVQEERQRLTQFYERTLEIYRTMAEEQRKAR